MEKDDKKSIGIISKNMIKRNKRKIIKERRKKENKIIRKKYVFARRIRLKSGIPIPNWDKLDLPPFEKYFYREHPMVANRNPDEVAKFRRQHQITIVRGEVPNPIEHFGEAHMPDYVSNEIRRKGYERPTPTQAQAWPIALSGLNMVGIAMTGSGKTLAFILPAIVHINNQPRQNSQGDGPIVLVLVPTRELAYLIKQVAHDFGASSGIRIVCAVGGDRRKDQLLALNQGCEILIATPGRLIDFLCMQETNLLRCTYLVLDEADLMLDKGLEPQIRRIVEQSRPDRQTLMWSATWPESVQVLATDFIGNYIQINIGSLKLATNHNIRQYVDVVRDDEKRPRLELLLNEIYLRNNDPGKILIFVRQKLRASAVHRYLKRKGARSAFIHGNKPQKQRNKLLAAFRKNRFNILVATDVASRGLDIEGINYVINLDYPRSSEDYVHRIGRSGRCDDRGTAFTFLTERNVGQAAELIQILEEANQEVSDSLRQLASHPMAEKPPNNLVKLEDRTSSNPFDGSSGGGLSMEMQTKLMPHNIHGVRISESRSNTDHGGQRGDMSMRGIRNDGPPADNINDYGGQRSEMRRMRKDNTLSLADKFNNNQGQCTDISMRGDFRGVRNDGTLSRANINHVGHRTEVFMRHDDKLSPAGNYDHRGQRSEMFMRGMLNDGLLSRVDNINDHGGQRSEVSRRGMQNVKYETGDNITNQPVFLNTNDRNDNHIGYRRQSNQNQPNDNMSAQNNRFIVGCNNVRIYTDDIGYVRDSFRVGRVGIFGNMPKRCSWNNAIQSDGRRGNFITDVEYRQIDLYGKTTHSIKRYGNDDIRSRGGRNFNNEMGIKRENTNSDMGGRRVNEQFKNEADIRSGCRNGNNGMGFDRKANSNNNMDGGKGNQDGGNDTNRGNSYNIMSQWGNRNNNMRFWQANNESGNRRGNNESESGRGNNEAGFRQCKNETGSPLLNGRGNNSRSNITNPVYKEYALRPG